MRRYYNSKANSVRTNKARQKILRNFYGGEAQYAGLQNIPKDPRRTAIRRQAEDAGKLRRQLREVWDE